jgi:L-ornithine Nalpha-acyltransferase
MADGDQQRLRLRLASDEKDVLAAQRLRYRVFYEELGAKANLLARVSGLDRDDFDAICDHLLVVDENPGAAADIRDGRLIGTYRLLRHEVALAHGGFYSQSEFDLEPLLARGAGLRLLEVGRSCVAKDYRGSAVAELLWQGIWDYVRGHGLTAMAGCASLPGTDPDALADELSFLAYHGAAPDAWRVSALAHRHVAMRRKAIAEVNQRAVLRRLPTLIKGYLRLGAYVGEGAVIDWQFNTTDVLILLPVSRINPKYFAHYGAPQAISESGNRRQIENVVGGG